ncbi:MAG: hypothetical protein GX025_10570 [Clostridiales bacterium]|nr:hypothetical protein [Clostridiales bacterium]
MVLGVINKATEQFKTEKAAGRVFDVTYTAAIGPTEFIEREEDRERLYDEYLEYFLFRFDFSRETHDPNHPDEFSFFQDLYDIYTMAAEGDIYLACWCPPRLCHGEIIMKTVNYALSQRPRTLHSLTAEEIRREALS